MIEQLTAFIFGLARLEIDKIEVTTIRNIALFPLVPWSQSRSMQPFLLTFLFLFLSPRATLSQESQIPFVDVPYDTEYESLIPKIAIIGYRPLQNCF